jgi:hypothetical protein
MSTNHADVPSMSDDGGKGYEVVDAVELAKRLKVPESWVRSRTRQRTPKAERIPCVKLGRYVRFEMGSPSLEAWLARHRQ